MAIAELVGRLRDLEDLTLELTASTTAELGRLFDAGEDARAARLFAGLLKRDEILFTDRSQVNHAYVVFDHEYQRRRALVLDWMEAQGLHPLGRFGRFEYDNSDQCVIKAREKAAAMLPDLLG